jgi:transketolase
MRCIKVSSAGHPHRARSLCNIAQYLYSRFTQLGTLSDLDEVLALERDALELRPKGHPDRAISLSNIASSLHTRFTFRQVCQSSWPS